MNVLAFVALLIAIGAPWSATAQEPAAVVTHLAEAIRIPTVSHQDREQVDTAAFDTFLAFLEDTYPTVFSTLEVERVNEYSLLLRWPGTQNDLEPVLFDAHYDVVPIEPGTDGDWTHPPFSGAIAEGYVWGRGSIDDKVAVIVTLEALESLAAEGFTPERTLYFSFVHDEEIGGEQGAGAVVELLQGRDVRLAYVVGEGGGLMHDSPLLPGQDVAMIGLAEKTYLTLTLRSSGTGGHSSTPPRDSSIVRLARALEKLHENPFDARLVAPVDDLLHALGQHQGGVTGWVLRNQWITEPLLVSQLAADPMGSAMVRTTTAVTMIDAGIKENVVPQRAEARVNFRVLPDESVEDVAESVRALIDDPKIEIIRQALERQSRRRRHRRRRLRANSCRDRSSSARLRRRPRPADGDDGLATLRGAHAERLPLPRDDPRHRRRPRHPRHQRTRLDRWGRARRPGPARADPPRRRPLSAENRSKFQRMAAVKRSLQLTSSNAGIRIQIMPSSDQLTIRSIGSRLRTALEQEAARRGQSLNKTVLALLAERLGLADSAARIEHDDLDELAGTWSKSDATRFDEALHAQRQVDAKLWR